MDQINGGCSWTDRRSSPRHRRARGEASAEGLPRRAAAAARRRNGEPDAPARASSCAARASPSRWSARTSPIRRPGSRETRGLRAVPRLVRYVAALWSAFGRCDVVHLMANSGWAWHLFAAPAIWVAWLRGRPVVVNYRGGEAERFLAESSRLVRLSLNRARIVAVPSRFLRRVFASHGVAAEVVPNIVDLERFAPRALPGDAPGEPARRRHAQPRGDLRQRDRDPRAGAGPANVPGLPDDDRGHRAGIGTAEGGGDRMRSRGRGRLRRASRPGRDRRAVPGAPTSPSIPAVSTTCPIRCWRRSRAACPS